MLMLFLIISESFLVLNLLKTISRDLQTLSQVEGKFWQLNAALKIMKNVFFISLQRPFRSQDI